ncbi:MAG: hypothetical protein ABIZ91_07745 [Gemmatimonadaceae bacterium]
MYSTCIFCNKSLGRNESIETFPVGARLAFDAARGRLWVVCGACERWNLSPLEERWEAIEEAERLFRDTRRRVSTEHVGLAKLRDGTTLVRIGEPQRPEFAAWRYGDQFGRRRTRAALVGGGGLAAVAGVIAGGAVAGVGIGAFGWMIAQMGQSVIYGGPESVVARIPTERHGLIHVRRRHLGESTLSPAADGSLSLLLRFKNGQAQFTGREADRIASIVVPKVNRFGGSKAQVAAAVSEIEATGHSEAFLSHLAKVSHTYTRPRDTAAMSRWRRRDHSSFHKFGLFGLPASYRLALEMALHEESERRAMEGEMQELERAWRDAEEIAAISDNLLVPESVDAAFRKLKGG